MNKRNPALNLDSVYGEGPFGQPMPNEIAVPYREDDRAKLKLGELSVAGGGGVVVPPVDDRARDLPRVNREAHIADARNDENLVVAQLHVAFLRFHDNAVDWVRDNEPERTGVGDVFSRARVPPGSELEALLTHLARRNLLRGFRLSIPTGQAVADALGIPPLTARELTDGLAQGVRDALDKGGFVDRTPLWFSILRESEVRTNGDALGPVGSRIVAETIIGQLRREPRSYLNQTGWTPTAGVRLPDGGAVTSIAAFLRFEGVL